MKAFKPSITILTIVKIVAINTALFFSLLVQAEANNSEVVRHFTHTDSEIITKFDDLGAEHELIVRLPEGYYNPENQDKSYPVLYVLDAYWDYPLISNIYSNLYYDKLIPEIIIVGLSYPGKDNDVFNQRRSFDFTPTPWESLPVPAGTLGGGPHYLNYIQNSVVPYIEALYRANPEDRALAGASMGGLFTLWTMYETTDYFKRYIVLSPFVLYNDGGLFDIDSEFASQNDQLNTKLYYAYGALEHSASQALMAHFSQRLQSHNYDGFKMKSRVIKGADHGSVKNIAYTRALKKIYRDIAPTEPNEEYLSYEQAEAFGIVDMILAK